MLSKITIQNKNLTFNERSIAKLQRSQRFGQFSKFEFFIIRYGFLERILNQVYWEMFWWNWKILTKKIFFNEFLNFFSLEKTKRILWKLISGDFEKWNSNKFFVCQNLEETIFQIIMVIILKVLNTFYLNYFRDSQIQKIFVFPIMKFQSSWRPSCFSWKNPISFPIYFFAK